MTSHRFNLALLIPLLALVHMHAAKAQDFTLFEPVENSAPQASSSVRPGREARATAAKPEFTLLGSARVGNEVSVILAHRDGGRIVVRTKAGSSVPVPDYSSYQLVATESGKISLILPAGSPCIAFPDSGVQCNDSDNVAELSLTMRPAVASNSLESTSIESAETTNSTTLEIIEDPGNPFARMRDRALNDEEVNQTNATTEPNRGNRFTPRRIPPSEVPPGMRVVSTPFGDRLVPQ